MGFFVWSIRGILFRGHLVTQVLVTFIFSCIYNILYAVHATLSFHSLGLSATIWAIFTCSLYTAMIVPVLFWIVSKLQPTQQFFPNKGLMSHVSLPFQNHTHYFHCIFIGIVVRLFQLQIVESNKYKGISKNRRIATYPLEATRGTIFDRNGKILAVDQHTFDITVQYKNLLYCYVRDNNAVLRIAGMKAHKNAKKTCGECQKIKTHG